MLIGIDGNEANVKEKVGVHIYALEVLKWLYKLQDNKNRFVIYLKGLPNKDLPPEREGWEYKIIPGNKFWVLVKLMPALVRGEKLDVFFTPSHYLPFFSKAPMVCTIHDLGYLMFSGQFKKYDFWQLRYWSAISISISKCIICPSKSTAKDIVRHYPFASKKVQVVNHGYDKSRFNRKISKTFVRQIIKKYGITKNYILFLSTLKPSKNVEGLLAAYSRLVKDFDYQLVIAGKKGWLYEPIFKKVKELGLEKEVVFTDYVPEKDKPALFTGAKVYVLPSFWEGFGIDVLSSYACGTPVIVSSVGSLPEVAGEAGIYLDPNKVESIEAGIRKILEMDSKRYNKQVDLGLKQVQKFSWQKAARQTLEILESASR